MELLKKLCNTDAVCGNEFNLRDIIVNEIKDYADSIEIDALNNIVAFKKGGEKKIMLTANTDEQGGIVTYIDDSGHIRFSGIGKLEAKYCPFKRVRFSNSEIGVICVEGSKDIKDCKFSDLYIDIGISDVSEVKKKVEIGNTFVICSDFYSGDESVFAKSLDNRAGVYALIQAFKKAGNTNSVYAVFTSQKNMGFKGAKLCGEYINPDIAVSVDGVKPSDCIMPGSGIVLKMRDKASVFSPELAGEIKEILEKEKIEYKADAAAEAVSEASAIISANSGVKICSVGICIQNYHTGCECVRKRDIESMIKFLEIFINQ